MKRVFNPMNGQASHDTDARFRRLVQEIRALRHAFGLPDVGERLFLLKLDTTNLCNLQCKHCGVHLIRDVVHPVSMSADLLQTLVTDVFPYCHEVCLGSLAEPLMSPLLDEMLEQGRAAGVPTLQVVTNALLLDERRARAWIEFQLDLVSVSLDAASPATYSRLRGGDLRTVVENVARLRDLKRQLGADRPRLRINFVVMRSNVCEMPAMVDLAYELGADILEFSLPFLDQRLDLEEELPLKDRALWESVMEQTRSRVEVAGLPRVVLPEVPAAPAGCSREEAQSTVPTSTRSGSTPAGCSREEARSTVPTSTSSGSTPAARPSGGGTAPASLSPRPDHEPLCLAPWTYLSVGPTGDVYPCCSPYRLGGPRFGNLGDDSLAAILTGPAYEELRCSLVTSSLHDDCARCKATDYTSLCELPEDYYLDVGPRLPRAGS